jgi:hypothetical protein
VSRGDAFNRALLTVRPEPGPPAVEVAFIDAADTVRHRARSAAR